MHIAQQYYGLTDTTWDLQNYFNTGSNLVGKRYSKYVVTHKISVPSKMF